MELCFTKIGIQWRSFKYATKIKYYYKFKTDEERLACEPPQVDPNQWKELVKHWAQEEAKKVAARNVLNRANLCSHPRTGRKSIAVVKQKMKRENEPIDKLNVWRYTRRKKDKSYDVNDGAADREETIKRRLDAVPSDQQGNEELRNVIFEDVIGFDGHGRALCKGVCMKPTSIRSIASSSSQYYQSEIARLEKEAEERENRYRQEAEERENRYRQEAEERENRYRQEAEERELRHKKELDVVCADLNHQIHDKVMSSQRNTLLECSRMLKLVGITLPDDTLLIPPDQP